ncbi:ABC transporter ATP-binding protein [Streptococcus equinus]|uniref:ABC transporter ATP-binding protein n=1 Tax=Streptococcus equinus TaxID=1335 RepID=UPI003BF862E1
MVSLLKVKNVYKSFDNQEILSDVNFDIKSGDIVGLIGKNGSGKTTLMKMILGFTPITKGEIIFNEQKEYTKNGSLNKIGFLLDCKLFEDFSAYDNLKLFSMYLNCGIENVEQRIVELLKFVGLDNNTKTVKTYSFGMKQRLGLALALLDEPEFLILDEPFVGLDPVGVRVLMNYIVKVRREKGVTVLISSHQLHEIEEICDYFLIVQNKHVRLLNGGDESKIIIELESQNEQLKVKLSDLTDIDGDKIILPYNMALLNVVLKNIYLLNGEIKKIEMIDTIKELFKE